MNRLGIAVGLLVGLAAWGAANRAAEGRPPNIVFVFSDDYGIPGVGCYGGKYATPQIDKLAANGLRFQYCFAMPLCAPSRAMTLSGQYPFRNGVTDNGQGAEIKPEVTTFAKVLQQSGYATAVAGKWRQLQYFDTPEDGRAWGFDEFMIWGANSNNSKGERYWNPAYNHNGHTLSDVAGKYGPDLLHDFVVDFMARHRADPFLIYYPVPLVHSPILPTPDSATKPDATTGSAKVDKKAARAAKKSGAKKDKKTQGKSSELYADNVAYLDKQVGKLVAEIDRLGLTKDTVIVFTGDNGSTSPDPQTINGREILGHKSTLLEGGSRVPLIVSWPGVTPTGKVIDDLVDFSDFYVTFAELAGVKLPSDKKVDGRSFAPQLRGQPGTPRDWVFVQLRQSWYARDKAFKLTESGKLFDLHDAPFTERPVPADSTDPAAIASRQRLQAVLDDLKPASAKAADTIRGQKKAKRQAKPQAKA